MAPTILIVEDDSKIARLLELELNHAGYATQVAFNGKDGLVAAENDIDLVLLDVMMPELSGFEVLRRLRGKGNPVPVILLTARGEVYDKVAGLDLGANDYVTKPFEIEELLARIRGLLRLTTQAAVETNQLHYADVLLDLDRHEAFRNDVPLDLTPREFDLLSYLMENKEHVLTREQILNRVWGYDYFGETNIVDVYIRYLRKKMDRSQSPLIQTVRGIGYVLREEKG
ncbi:MULTISPECIES: response regulator transcription factor [Exiguobacterium]|uniref:Two component transcriptional regulator, winged helix family n=1 Tax=Exiguobacterium sibiricum (strain DSM 17290 / CCUG 55495 / CIP 109462 / JCM 13490 / 255-15) TaxID=262543 RepID=B1YF65_EXIS2|nr:MULTISPECIES: response regulator transcription factor [Exiguobacterium]ACB62289.1 two component transcriptional regulator, winged helix family [Exiguobacterium sibiricum 255-15]RDB32866.1 DNA-binding response regulator [Exiguobacterium sp. RIT594]